MKLTCVTLSGPDSDTDIGALLRMQECFPLLEIGVLWLERSQGEPRYPDAAWIEAASAAGLRFSLHLCGASARRLMERGELPEFPGVPRRIQINGNGMKGAPGWFRGLRAIQYRLRERDADNVLEFIIQTGDYAGAYWVGMARAEGIPAVPLFDRSGGRGKLPDRWPNPLPHIPCGYAGGIGPENVGEVVGELLGRTPADVPFWIDMETNLRTQDAFDLGLSQRVLESVQGALGSG